VDEEVEILRWLRCWLEMIREYDNGEDNWVEEHDYHIIMERCMSIMFWGYFDDAV
jgi:hypothetical protein